MNTMAMVPSTSNGGNNNMMQMYGNPSAVAAAEKAKAEIQAAFIMAYQCPRDEDTSRIKILKECARPKFAETVEYKIPFSTYKDNKKITTYITGPTIRLAELIAKYWRNLRIDTSITYEDVAVQRIKVSVIDLETNVNYNNEVEVVKLVERSFNKDGKAISQRKNSKGEDVFLIPATDEEVRKSAEIQKSKAIRKCIQRLVPQDIIDECIETAHAALASEDKKDPEAARLKTITAFAKIGVMPVDLAKFLGHDSSFIRPEELIELRGVYSAMQEGRPWSDFVPEVSDDGVKPSQRDNKEVKEKEKPAENTAQLKNAFQAKMREAGLDPKTAYVDFVKTHLQKDPKKTAITAAEYGTLNGILQGIIDTPKSEQKEPVTVPSSPPAQAKAEEEPVMLTQTQDNYKTFKARFGEIFKGQGFQDMKDFIKQETGKAEFSSLTGSDYDKLFEKLDSFEESFEETYVDENDIA